MRIGRILTASAIAAVSSLLLGSAAFAQKTVPINPSHIGENAQFDVDCTGPLAAPLIPGADGWHFILPAAAGEDFVSVTIVYSGGVTANITSINPAAPSTGTGYSGYIAEAGQSGAFRHAYIWTSPAGQTIVSGTAQVLPEGSSPRDQFNLSHTCPGTPSTPTPTPTVTASPTVAPSGGAETGGGASHGVTFAGIGALALAGAAGVWLFLYRRRDEIA